MSAIEWTQQTWNPIAGCTKVSPGCANCYAEVMAGRLDRMGMMKYQGLTVLQGKHIRWTGKIALDERVLLKPLQTKKPTTYFVNSMSDLFHEGVTDEQIDRIFAVMALCPQHTFQVLTKRPERMLTWFTKHFNVKSPGAREMIFGISHKHPGYVEGREWIMKAANAFDRWPLPNLWLGVSVENQATADERIPLLLDTPAAVRFISAEPLLDGLNLERIRWTDGMEDIWFTDALEATDIYGDGEGGISDGPHHPALDWVIVGGESGYGSRECNVEWIRSIVKQCTEAGVPVFVKQLGMKPYIGKPGNRLKQMDRKKGGWMDSWPEDLRVRQMPEVSR